MFVYKKNRPLPREKWTAKHRTTLAEKLWQGKHGMVPAKMRRRTGQPLLATLKS